MAVDAGRLADGLAAAGVAAYALHSWVQIHAQLSVLDEGLYLFKGVLFWEGRYRPFQDFGPWTNHPPLAFLIPGAVQAAFGPGIRTGRYYALALGILLMIGVWILARRLGGRWAGAMAVWAMALNVFLVKVYSQAISEVLVAAILAWSLVLALGPDRRPAQIVLGAALSGALVMTRINMLFVPPILVAYVLWQHGRKLALWAALASGAVIVGLHGLYWPGILKLWAYWLPEGLTPFLAAWRESSGSLPYWDPHIQVAGRVESLRLGFQSHLVPVAGLLLAVAAWPRRTPEWRSERKVGAFLIASSVSLVLIHAWASLTKNYCVYCFQLYLAFFSFLGILLLALALGHWLPGARPGRQVLAGLAVLALFLLAGQKEIRLGFAALADTFLPRVAHGSILPGSVRASVFLEAVVGLEPQATTAILAAATGVWLVVSLGLTLGLVSRLRPRRSPPSWPRLLRRGLGLAALGWGAVLSLAFGANLQTYDCGGDVIRSYEEAGAYLAPRIPPDAQVYWATRSSPVPLLYLSSPQVFPPQLNGDYSFRLGGDPDSLLRVGFWNQELAEDWLDQADYILVEDNRYEGWLASSLTATDFDEVSPSPRTAECRRDSSYRIFRRLR
jgi:hypothetical protein